MPEFKLEQSDEIIIGSTGLATVGKLLQQTSLEKRVNDMKLPNAKNPKVSNYEVLSSYMGILVQGKTNFDDIEEFRDNDFFSKLLGINNIPSSPTLRQRLNKGAGILDQTVKEETINLLKIVNPNFSICNYKKEQQQPEVKDLVPLDCDSSPFDNSNTQKEGVSRTYKGYNGYHPSFSYFGKEGYLLNVELKEGKTHSQNGAEQFLSESIDNAKKLIDNDKNILVRLDAGYDSKDIVQLCRGENVKFIIKRNLRNQNKQKLMDFVRNDGEVSTPRKGKKIYRGSFKKEPSWADTPLRVIYEVTEETIDKDGQMRLEPEIEIDLYWTNLENAQVPEVIELYHKHGTSEQFHSEIKTDMDLERLPSGKFNVNQLVLILGMLAYNILRLMGQISLHKNDSPLKGGVQRRRIRTTIQNLIMTASKLVYHARQYILKFGSQCPWFRTFKRVHKALT